MLDNENASDATGVGDDNQNTGNGGNAENAGNSENTGNNIAGDNTGSVGNTEGQQNDEAATEPTKTTRTRRRAASRPAGPPPEVPEPAPASASAAANPTTVPAATFQPPTMVVFQPPEVTQPTRRTATEASRDAEPATDDPDADEGADDESGADRPGRRRRRRGGRGRGRSKDADGDETAESDEDAESAETGGETGRSADGDGKDRRQDKSKDDKSKDKTTSKSKSKDKAKEKEKGKGKGKDETAAAAAGDEGGEPGAADARDADDEQDDGQGGAGTRRRRRRRRRSGGGDGEDSATDDPPNTVVHVREPRAVEDEVQAVKGSTRLEAKKQRRREGREHGRRRPPIVTESEFLARRESVERVMVIRRQGERTQIAVLEDGVLVEHYVDRASHQSYVGNVYLGKVQNVLPSMEAAFVDIGKGRNAVLYAGEVNWDTVGLEGQPRRIESALKSGQSVLVQVTKDPLGHKGARLTSQISLPGRYLVYVPDGSMTGISRKLPDKGRNRGRAVPRRVTAVRAVGEHPATGQDRLGARAAVRRARPDHPGRPRRLQRGLHQAGRLRRGELGHGVGVRAIRGA